MNYPPPANAAPSPDNTALVILDLQEKFLPALPDLPAAAARTAVLAAAFRELGAPVLVTEQYPQGLGPTVEAVRLALPPGTPVVEKTAFSALGEEAFRQALVALPAIKNLVIAGIEAHICVYQTALSALEHGFGVWVISDAVASRRARDCADALADLRARGVPAVPSETLIFQLLKTSGHPAFRTISRLIR